MVNKERDKHWLLTFERALENYELIQQTLDPNQWDVIIKSENVSVPIEDFIKKAKTRIRYDGVNNYNPGVVAEDAITILESLNTTFDLVRRRLEDSFKSILIVNEDMGEYLKKVEEDEDEKTNELSDLKKQNDALRGQLEEMQQEVDEKMEGIKPLTNVINIRVKEIISLYNDFKSNIGNEEDMKKFIPIFENEVDTTIKLIELRRKQVLESKINYSNTPEVFGEESSSEPESKIEEEEAVDDDAVFPEEGDEEDQTFKLPDKYEKDFGKYKKEIEEFDDEIIEEAITLVKPSKLWNSFMYYTELRRCCKVLVKGEKYHKLS